MPAVRTLHALATLVLATLVLATLAVAAPLAAQGSYRFVALHVSDEGTQAPLPGVRVAVQGVADRDWTTDDRGDVLLAVAPERPAVLQLRRIGYASRALEIAAGSNQASLRVTLSASALQLDTAKIVGDARSQMLAGFEHRRSLGAGSATFITREQIDKQMALRTIDVVRRAVGTRVIDSSGVLLVASSRGAKTIIAGSAIGKNAKSGDDLAPCVMRVAVDGMIREWGYSLDEIDPKELHGVEVYPGPATIPAEFSGMRKDAYCGLVMIWTRRGP